MKLIDRALKHLFGTAHNTNKYKMRNTWVNLQKDDWRK